MTWLILAGCVVAVAAILRGIIHAAIRREQRYIGRPRHYRARHRRRWDARMHTPGPAHPAWLGMERIGNLNDPATRAEIAWLEDLFAKDAAE